MASLVTIQASDLQSDSRTDINDNFDALNTEIAANLSTVNSSKVTKAGDTMTGQLNFSGTNHAGIKVLSLTTAQRDALTPSNGMMIYNTTNAVFEVYSNSAWRTLLMQKQGGDGSDGPLTVSSGNTNVDLGGARVFVKNYSSISITDTGSVTFTNPHAEGTLIYIRYSETCTLTSSAAPMLDASGCGGQGAAAYSGSSGGGGTNYDNSSLVGNNGNLTVNYIKTNGGVGATNAANGAAGPVSTHTYQPTLHNVNYEYIHKMIRMFVGAGGGQGGGSATASSNVAIAVAGHGGGALFIEGAGAWNFTTTSGISVAGKNGGNATINSGTGVAIGGSGAGSGGSFFALVGSITANTGTVNVSGGTGGNAAAVSPSGQVARGGGSGSSLTAGNAGTNTTTNGVKTGGDGVSGVSYGVVVNTQFT